MVRRHAGVVKQLLPIGMEFESILIHMIVPPTRGEKNSTLARGCQESRKTAILAKG